MTISKKVNEEPKISFSSWKPWRRRETTYDPTYTVPRDFDMPGIYLLAQFDKTGKIPKSGGVDLHLNSQVIYVGASTKVTHRLEGKRHEAVNKKYVEMCNDPEFNKLFYTICHLEWKDFSTQGEIGKVKRAYLYYVERKVIWEYAKKYNRLPLLNNQ